MEWEEVVKAGIVALFGFVGHAILKLLKKKFTPFYTGLKNISEIEGIRANANVHSQIFDAMIEIHRSPIYYTDESGMITYVNTAWVELTGFINAEDAHGMGYMRAVSDEDEQEIMAINENYYKHPTDLEGVVVFVNLRSKIRIPCKYRSRVVRNSEGKFVKGIGILEIIKN